MDGRLNRVTLVFTQTDLQKLWICLKHTSLDFEDMNDGYESADFVVGRHVSDGASHMPFR